MGLRSTSTSRAETGFSNIDELISNQGDVAVIIEEDPDKHRHFIISAYMDFDSDTLSPQDISYSYLSACDLSVTNTDIGSVMYISYDLDSQCSIQIPSTTSTLLITY